jgi:hypothetical protein
MLATTECRRRKVTHVPKMATRASFGELETWEASWVTVTGFLS